VAAAQFSFVPRSLGFSVAASTNAEASALLPIPVILNLASMSPVEVAYRVTAETTATGGGEDFTLEDGILRIPVGELRADLVLAIHNDDLKEPLERVVIRLEYPAGAFLASSSLHTHYIVDDDSPLDSDGDLIPDEWEVDRGLDPANPGDGGMDPDEDGLTSAEEYMADTNPLDGESWFRIESVLVNPVRVVFLTSAARRYTLQVRQDLASGNWSDVEGLVGVGGTGEIITWPLTTGSGRGFFRVLVQLP
jgi:hypothetical protein